MGKQQKDWPKNCIWPKPIESAFGSDWDAETAMLFELDDYGEELKEIKEYFDDLVSEGILTEDYELIEEELMEDDLPFEPEKGEDYWLDNRFEREFWQDDFLEHVDKLKISSTSIGQDPAFQIRNIIHYEFINENLLRQAFTTRAFAAEYRISDCNEQLEFYGDMVLNTIITKQLYAHYASVEADDTAAPFHSAYREGELSRIREHYISRDHLSSRARQLGLDKLVLCGRNEVLNDSALEDVMEALLGAAAADTNWNWDILEEITDRLVLLQFDDPDQILRKSNFETLNEWHQKHFSELPQYEISPVLHEHHVISYHCTLRFFVPENEKKIPEYQRMEAEMETRSQARECAAEFAIRFIKSRGLWMRINDAITEPDYENSINQLQELYQKHYIEKPEYEFEEEAELKKGWKCKCICGSFKGFGFAAGKIPAKKMASYMTLIRILESSGIHDPKWNEVLDQMYR